MSEPMYSPPPPPPIAPPPSGPGAAQQVQGPALGLLITAGIAILFSLLGLVMNLLGVGMSGLQNLGGSDASAQYARYFSGGIGIVSSVICIGLFGFVAWAALQMKQLRGWTLAVVARVIALIPCFCPSCVISRTSRTRTRRADGGDLSKFLLFVGRDWRACDPQTVEATQVDAAAVRAFLGALTREGLGKRSQGRALAAARGVLRWAVRDGRL